MYLITGRGAVDDDLSPEEAAVRGRHVPSRCLQPPDTTHGQQRRVCAQAVPRAGPRPRVPAAGLGDGGRGGITTSLKEKVSLRNVSESEL